MKNKLESVLTTKEASEQYNIADCTIRTWMEQKLLNEGEYRKSGGTWLMDKHAFLNLLRRKNLYGKTFELEGEQKVFEFLGFREKKLEIWYENADVRDVLKSLPMPKIKLDHFVDLEPFSLSQLFKFIQKDYGMKFDYVLITHDFYVKDNWYYKKKRTWVITLNAVLDLLTEVFARWNLDSSSIVSHVEQKRKEQEG